MDRRTLTVLVVAALAALAIGLAAATLSSTLGPDEDESSGEGSGQEGTTGGAVGPAPDAPAFLELLMMVLGAIATLGVIGYLVLYPRKGGATIAAVLLMVLVLVVALQFPEAIQQQAEEPLELLPGPDNESQNATEDGSDSVPLNLSPALIGGLLTVLMLGVLLVLRQSDDEEDADDAETEPEAEDTAALGAIAGRTADRIEESTETSTDAENEVYRAWREMTAQLDIENEETTTPREFQARAVDAGIEPDDVRELTALFEAVRYGGEAATEDREQRALAVLRRIESKYGEENA